MKAQKTKIEQGQNEGPEGQNESPKTKMKAQRPP